VGQQFPTIGMFMQIGNFLWPVYDFGTLFSIGRLILNKEIVELKNLLYETGVAEVSGER